ncbi:DUF3135 domain-containing protein [Nitrincola sp. MINF-07-Sa-05]|uniref:DUF3135 domain-containing protein n=1 Tax=Nitrincola salilacus TaxID=3400273 RepID=UPI003917CBB4
MSDHMSPEEGSGIHCHTPLPCFDEMRDMHRNHPEKLEALRLQLTDEVMRRTAPARKPVLERLVFRIDAERVRCKNSLGLCIRFSNMMHERFWMMSDLLKSFSKVATSSTGLDGEAVTSPDSHTGGATVVSLSDYRQQKLSCSPCR